MTGYKVVAHVDGELVSCTYHGRTLSYGTERDTFPEAGDGPLAVFPTLNSAELFVRTNRVARGGTKWEIWECDYDPSPDTTLWYLYKTFSGEHIQLTAHDTVGTLPLKTCFASRVRLIKEM